MFLIVDGVQIWPKHCEAVACGSKSIRPHGLEMTVYFTGLGSKTDFMQIRGMKVDIWIDDDPRKCALGH